MWAAGRSELGVIFAHPKPAETVGSTPRIRLRSLRGQARTPWVKYWMAAFFRMFWRHKRICENWSGVESSPRDHLVHTKQRAELRGTFQAQYSRLETLPRP